MKWEMILKVEITFHKGPRDQENHQDQEILKLMMALQTNQKPLLDQVNQELQVNKVKRPQETKM